VNVLWVFAHPERGSLSGSLRDEGIRALAEGDHKIRVSDLYGMKWKATVDRDDFTDAPERSDGGFVVTAASQEAYRTGTLSPDILAEHEKLDWADVLVLQFPLWWYGMPAILKGWFDRVFVKGYAYGVRDPENPGRTLRYGEGKLAGKRAVVLVTAGSPEKPMGPRGVNGQLDHVLFPLLHGTLWYAGMSVLPPVAVYGADRMSKEGFSGAAATVRERMTSIGHTPPLPFRSQNGGDYDDDLVLRPELAAGTTGLGVHYRT